MIARALGILFAIALSIAAVFAANRWFWLSHFDLWPADDSCKDDHECQPGRCRDELAAIRSPDGSRTAIAFLLTGGGATVASAGEVCIEENGRRRVVARGYKSDSLRMAWQSPTLLRIDSLSYDPRANPTRTVDVTARKIACEPVRPDWTFCEPDGTSRR